MKSRQQRLIEAIRQDINDHIFMELEENQLEELIEYLETDTLPCDWQDNDYIIRAENDLHDLCMEFGV